MVAPGEHLQHWSLRFYFREAREGYILMYEHLKELVRAYLNRHRDGFIGRFRILREKDDLVDVAKGIERGSSYGSLQLKNSTSTSSSTASLTTHSRDFRSSKIQEEDDLHPTTLHHSFLLLAKMLNSILLYIPGFGLSLRLGFVPSRLFIFCSYLLLAASILCGLFLSRFILESSIEMFVHKMNKNLKQVCITATLIGQYGYVIFGLFSCGYVFYQRRFLQEFIYHRLSVITLARSYQRRQICYLFMAFNGFALVSEPLFSLLAIFQDVHQPRYWPHLEQMTFRILKVGAALLSFLGALLVSASGATIPLMTCHLIVSLTKHLKNLITKQSARYNQTAIWAQSKHNESLEDLVTSATKKIMVDFACETLTMDWPDLVELDDQAEQEFEQDKSPAEQFIARAKEDEALDEDGALSLSLRARSLKKSYSSLSSPQHSNYNGGSNNFLFESDLMLQQQQQPFMPTTSKLGSSKASCLLFLYKNLIKNMSELKCIITSYERKFGSFHQISTLISCLVVSLWVTSALTDVRQKSAIAAAAARDDDSDTLATFNQTRPDSPIADRQKTAYTLRILGSTIAFVLSNVFIFLKCDCLSDRIIKMKSQLFKMNIDLACTLINAQQQLQQRSPSSIASSVATVVTIMPKIKIDGEEIDYQLTASPPSSVSSSAASSPRPRTGVYGRSVYEVDHFRHPLQQEQYVNQCPELDQVWSLYDQVDRISMRVNFKFAAETYYSKRCMLLVFGRGVSLILFFIQIIDMYSS